MNLFVLPFNFLIRQENNRNDWSESNIIIFKNYDKYI